MEVENAFFNTSDYNLQHKVLGKGTYGKVYLAERISDHEEFAAKVINVGSEFDGHEQMLFLRESFIMQKLNHAAIVKFIGINFRSFSDQQYLQPTIITEYLRHGSLKDILLKEKSSLSNKEWTATKKYINLLGISDALRYLHEHGIAHRDLKPENILLDDDYYPRVCDFGFSKYCTKSLTKSTNLSMSRQFGTPLYLPPEILSGDEIYNQSVDVYAFALIAYEIVTGKQPFSELFESTSEFLSYQKIIDGYRPKFPSFVDEKMRDLITRCWSERPEDRPTFKEIFEELSNDLTYFTEFVDETEIQDYLYLLSQTNEEQQKKKSNSSLKSENQSHLEKQLNELKAKISELQNDQDLLY